jgi:hypothetical protein
MLEHPPGLAGYGENLTPDINLSRSGSGCARCLENPVPSPGPGRFGPVPPIQWGEPATEVAGGVRGTANLGPLVFSHIRRSET